LREEKEFQSSAHIESKTPRKIDVAQLTAI